MGEAGVALLTFAGARLGLAESIFRGVELDSIRCCGGAIRHENCLFASELEG